VQNRRNLHGDNEVMNVMCEMYKCHFYQLFDIKC
jgi:hypothetical protein